MFEPIFARAGTDKKSFIIERIKEKLASSERRLMMVVPEQSSFETEKELYIALGDRLYSRVDVLSFTRLCSLYYEIKGIRREKKLSSAGKIILSSCAAALAAPDLKVYSGQASNATFIEKIASIIDELKVAGISSDALLEKKNSLNMNKSLENKIEDLSLIYSYYEAQLKNGYLDPSDELSLLNTHLGDGSFFKDYDVIIDEFASFNSAQLGIIEKMFANSPSVAVILCLVNDSKKIPAAFRTPGDTYRGLKERAKKNSVIISKPHSLEAGALYNNEQLKSLEAFACAQSSSVLKGDNVKVYSSPSLKRESRFVAAEIKRLVKEKNYRYRDIAVIGRNMDDYMSYLEDSFKLYDIPFFSDMRALIDTRPIVVFIINLLETLIGKMEPSYLLRLLKSGISYVDADDIALFENYIELWKIKKSELTAPFYKNPDGLSSDINTELLQKLNQIREKAVTPVVLLNKKLSGASGREITEGLYEFMKENGVLKNLSDYTERVAEGDSALASEQYRAFEICMSVMTQLSAIIGDDKITLKRYLELFRLAVTAEDVGSIPHHLDEVQIGDAGRTTPQDFKAVFLIGMNDGIFPARHTEDGFFSDEDREIIRIDGGIDILTTSKLMNQNEEYYLYRALTSPSELLYILYSQLSIGAEELFPSKIVSRLDKLEIKAKSIASLSPEYFFGTDEAAFEQLCLTYNQNTKTAKSLREYFFSLISDEYRNRFLSIDTDLKLRYSKLSDEVAKKLYKSDMLISPTQMDSFQLCQFAHFCKYGLALKKQEPVQIAASNTGTAVHDVLQNLLEKYSPEQLNGFSDAELDKIIEKMLEEFIYSNLGDENSVNNRNRYSIKRLKTTVMPSIKYVLSELGYSGYTPSDFELEIARGKGIEPYMIKTPDGNSVGIKGKIDRVDTKSEDDKTLVRIIDYKTGSKVFDKNDMNNGINLQMFMYLFSIWENGKTKYGDNIVPSGVLYMPAKRQDIEAKGGVIDEDVQKKKREALRMMGMLLEDEKTAKDKDKAFFSAEYSDITGFRVMKEKTEKMLCDMTDTLRIGELSINPLYNGDKNLACTYCEYKAVCGFEEGDFCREMKKTQGDEE